MAREETFEALVKHLGRFGPEGILESASGLSEEEYDRLEVLVKAERKRRKTK